MIPLIKRSKVFFNTALICMWVILLALFLRWTLLEVYMLPFRGMTPTLFAGDYIVVNKMAYGLRQPFSSRYISRWAVPQRGEVVIFRSPFDSSALSVRRVVGLPGDRVFFENGNLYVNEKKIKKQPPLKRKKNFSWLKDKDFSHGGLTEDKTHYNYWEEKLSNKVYSVLLKKKRKGYLVFGPYKVPPRYYFVMGDHRDGSQDSRTWPTGAEKEGGKIENMVFEEDILGRVSRVWFSCEKHLTIVPFLCDLRYIRRGRFFFPVH